MTELMKQISTLLHEEATSDRFTFGNRESFELAKNHFMSSVFTGDPAMVYTEERDTPENVRVFHRGRVKVVVHYLSFIREKIQVISFYLGDQHVGEVGLRPYYGEHISIPDYPEEQSS